MLKYIAEVCAMEEIRLGRREPGTPPEGDGRGEGRKGPGAAGTEEQIFRGGDHRGDEAGRNQ